MKLTGRLHLLYVHSECTGIHVLHCYRTRKYLSVSQMDACMLDDDDDLIDFGKKEEEDCVA